MTESTAWFVRRRGRVEGPWELKKLQSEVALRRLARYDEISLDRAKWMPAGDLAELFPPTPATTARYPLQTAASVASVEAKPLPAQGDHPYAIAGKRPGSYGAPHTALGPLGVPTWYYDQSGEADGPHPIETILSLLNQRRLTLNDAIWRDGFDDWQTIGQVEEIVRHLGVPASAAPMQAQAAVDTGARRARRGSRSERPSSGYALGAWSLILAGVLLAPSLAPGCGMLGLFPFVMSCIAVYEANPQRRQGIGFAYGGMALSALEMLLALIWFAYLYGAGSSTWEQLAR